MAESETQLLLTKLLPLFVYPLGLAMLLALLGSLCMLFKRRGFGLIVLVAGVALLWICSTPAFARWALGSLERQYPPVAVDDSPFADVAIVLGGAIGPALPPRKTLELSEAADRVLHAARLYKARKVSRILVTAGNLPWLPADNSEAEQIRELLFEWGVPQAAVEIAGASRNTYENALEVKALREKSAFASALLVTSASHMPRALAVFRSAGLPVTPSTTDVQVVNRHVPTPIDWLPDAGALEMTTTAVKEWIGLWAYRGQGYL